MIHPPFENADQERDAIFSLLAFAAVEKTWDESPLGEGGGHNIGAVLVDKKHRPVFWARNESTGRRDLTEHAEVRLIRGYIASQPALTELHKHQIFTTLEPCAMCAGMMAMTNVARLVFAQTDPVYGGVFDKLASEPSPYPKRVEALPAAPAVTDPVNDAFQRSGYDEAIQWLPTSRARVAFEHAAEQFADLSIAFTENAPHLADARRFLKEEVS